jgi:integrase
MRLRWENRTSTFFQDVRNLACTLIVGSGGPIGRAQEVTGHANILTALKIYAHAMNRRHHGAVDRTGELAGFADVGNNRETTGVMEPEK